MQLIKWDAYNFVGNYVDVLEWRASFLFYNERQTLIEDIEEKILNGKAVIFDCECEGEHARVTCVSGESFLTQIIGDLESNFIIRQIDKDNYRIDMMPKNNVEIVTFITRAFEQEVQ